MRRTSALFIVLALVFTCVLGLAACGEDDVVELDKLEIEGLVFDNIEVEYTGEAISAVVKNLPEGVTVTYEGNGVKEVGTHTVKAILHKDGFKDLELTATITIKAKAEDNTKPDQGGDITKPDQGGDNTKPEQGGDITKPDQGGDNTKPDQGGDITKPDQGGDITKPDQGGDNTKPDQGGDITKPDQGGDNTKPKPKPSNAPVYTGMTIGDANTVALASQSSEDIYCAGVGEDIFIVVHFNNKKQYEILSFTLNGKKYSSYMFEANSDMENIIVKVNVGNEPGVQSFVIDAIKYVNGEQIRDVRMAGKRSIDVNVKKHMDLSQVVFTDRFFTFDGMEHSLEADNLPADVTVSYENNNKIDVGEYIVKATLTGEHYFTETLEAKLTIAYDLQNIEELNATFKKHNGKATDTITIGGMDIKIAAIFEVKIDNITAIVEREYTNDGVHFVIVVKDIRFSVPKGLQLLSAIADLKDIDTTVIDNMKHLILRADFNLNVENETKDYLVVNEYKMTGADKVVDVNGAVWQKMVQYGSEYTFMTNEVIDLYHEDDPNVVDDKDEIFAHMKKYTNNELDKLAKQFIKENYKTLSPVSFGAIMENGADFTASARPGIEKYYDMADKMLQGYKDYTIDETKGDGSRLGNVITKIFGQNATAKKIVELVTNLPRADAKFSGTYAKKGSDIVLNSLSMEHNIKICLSSQLLGRAAPIILPIVMSQETYNQFATIIDSIISTDIATDVKLKIDSTFKY